MDRESFLNRKRELRVSKRHARGYVLYYVRRTIVVSLIVAAVFYIVISGSMTRIVWTNVGVVSVTSPAFRGGYAHEGDFLYVNENGDHNDSFIENVLSTFKRYSHISVVEVKAGPYGKVDWKPSGLTTVDGRIVDATIPQDPGTKYLDDQYIVSCVSGDCEEGQVGIIDHGDIFGVPSKGIF